MNIYIATSWAMKKTAVTLAQRLREEDFEVDCFCEEHPIHNRYVFHWTEFVDKKEDLQNYDALSFLNDPRTQRAFKEDKKWLDWADVCILIVPSGRSAHLEAGYAKGQGKKLYVLGGFLKGHFDVMYGFADGLFRWEEFDSFLKVLQLSKNPSAPRKI